MEARLAAIATLLTTLGLATNVQAANPAHVHFLGANLESANLSRANLSKANLSRDRLSYANLSDADLRGASLYEARLRSAEVKGANLIGADLRGANLFGVDLSSATVDSKVPQSNSSGATSNTGSSIPLSPSEALQAQIVHKNKQTLLATKRCPGCDLTSVDLGGADLSGVNLSGAILGNANLRGTNLSRANLRGAEVSNADLIGANLSGADLSEANLWRSILIKANLSDANLKDADISAANLREAEVKGANLDAAISLVLQKSGKTATSCGAAPPGIPSVVNSTTTAKSWDKFELLHKLSIQRQFNLNYTTISALAISRDNQTLAVGSHDIDPHSSGSTQLSL